MPRRHRRCPSPVARPLTIEAALRSEITGMLSPQRFVRRYRNSAFVKGLPGAANARIDTAPAARGDSARG